MPVMVFVAVVLDPICAPGVAAGINRLCLCSAANRAGIGLHARRCAGRRGGHCAFVPVVRAFLDFRLTAAIHFPVFIGISLPIAQLAGVIIGVRLAGFEGLRAFSIADAGLPVHRLGCAGRIGLLMTTCHPRRVDADGYIRLIVADGALMEVACIVSIPRGGVAVFSFSAPLSAFALVPVFAVTCLPLVGIGMVGFTALCSAFALVPVLGAILFPRVGIGMLGYILFVLADGAFLPVVSLVFLGAVTVLAGEEFDFSIISFGDDADGAVAVSPVLEIGRVGGSTVVHRDFLVAVIARRKVRGHDDGGGGGLTKVAGKAEVRPGVEKYIVCRAGGQIAAFIRWAVVLVAAEVQAAGKGDIRIISHQTYSAALARGLVVDDGALLEGKR